MKWPTYTDTDVNAAVEVLRSGDLCRIGNLEVTKFEQSLSEFDGSKFAIAVTNGTHAICLALRASGIGPGDYVCVPGYTFMSTAHAVYEAGAIPIPVDVCPQSLCMSIDHLREDRYRKAKAILYVGINGVYSSIKQILDLANSRGQQVILDSAQGIGAEISKLRLGELGVINCYSFQQAKLLSSGEGGAITCNDPAVSHKASLLHNCGRELKPNHYEFDDWGSNYRMTELSAALLRSQLPRFGELCDSRNDNHRMLAKQTVEYTDKFTLQTADACQDVNPLYAVSIILSERYQKDRDRLIDYLRAQGIDAYRSYNCLVESALYQTVMSPSVLRDYGCLPTSEVLSKRALNIPHYEMLGDRRGALIANHLRDFFGAA